MSVIFREFWDASALEKHYHRKCLRSGKYTFTPTDSRFNEQLIHSMCNEYLLFSIQNSLTDGEVTLNMIEVNDAYFLLVRF